jgi:hypothetical protein
MTWYRSGASSAPARARRAPATAAPSDSPRHSALRARRAAVTAQCYGGLGSRWRAAAGGVNLINDRVYAYRFGAFNCRTVPSSYIETGVAVASCTTTPASAGTPQLQRARRGRPRQEHTGTH